MERLETTADWLERLAFDDEVGLASKGMALVMALVADNNGTVWRLQSELADLAGVTPRTIRNHLDGDLAPYTDKRGTRITLKLQPLEARVG